MNLDLANDFWRCAPDTFAQKMSDGKWVPYRHLLFLSKLLTRAVLHQEKPARIVISTPPQHGKTEFIFWFVSWYLNLFPENSVIWTSYSEDHAVKYSERMRALFDHPLSITKVNRSIRSTPTYWETTEGGEQKFVGMTGALTGGGFNLGIIDDPIKNEKEARNPRIMANHTEWFRKTFYTRARGNAPIIVIQTRWTQDDLAGFLIKKHIDDWVYINLPALAHEEDPLGRLPGEALCPELHSQKKLEAIKADDEDTFNPLYDGNPTPKAGLIWKKRYFNEYIDAGLPPRFDEIILSLDATFDDDGTDPDEVCFLILGRLNQKVYVLDMICEVMDFADTIKTLKILLRKWPSVVTKLIEKKANGSAIRSTLSKQVDGIVMVSPLGSKIERAEACLPFLKAGLIYKPSDDEAHPWVKKFMSQITSFPRARRDDIVDALSQGVIFLLVENEEKLNTTEILKNAIIL